MTTTRVIDKDSDDDGVKGAFRVPNPDNTTTLIQTGSMHWLGGRTFHLGTAAVDWGVNVSLDPNIKNNFQQEQRQRDSVQAMADAFHRSKDELEAQPIDEAALQLEVDFTIARDSDISKVSINETVIMSSQRWLIVALPMELVKRVIKVALMYRGALRPYNNLVEMPMPNAPMVFSHMLSNVTEEDRPDIISLLSTLLSEPDHVNCYVYSEPDHRIVAAWRGFQRSPEAKTLKGLPLTSSASEIIEYTTNRAGMMDITTCYWCEKNCLSCNLFLCQKCRTVSYCGRACQTNDWLSFHKVECKQIASKKKTKEELGMKDTRLNTLQKGVQRATHPILIAPPDDATSVWRRDLLLLYVLHADYDADGISCRLGSKTKGFPRGLVFRTREDQDFTG
jgi:hypothetical protein